MKLVFNALIEGLIVLGLISFLSGCSPSEKIVLYNGSESTIFIKPLGELYEDRDYKSAEPGTTVGVHLDLSTDQILKIVTGSSSWCYRRKEVGLGWVGKGPKLFAKLGKDLQIYIYPKASKEDTFYTKSFPVQPKGYPLMPNSCKQTGSGLEL